MEKINSFEKVKNFCRFNKDNEVGNFICEFCEDAGDIDYWKVENDGKDIVLYNCFCICEIGLRRQGISKKLNPKNILINLTSIWNFNF